MVVSFGRLLPPSSFIVNTMKLILENIDIWQCRDALYCKRSDGHLIKILSSHLDKVRQVLHSLQTEKLWQDIQDETLCREEWDEIIRFLLQNQIVRQAYSNPQGHIRHKKLGIYAAEDVFEQTQQGLGIEGFQLDFRRVEKPSDLDGLQFLLVLAPVFDHYQDLEEISHEAYRRQIPLLYAEFSPTCISIGPLVEPSMETPSLACYMKRKKMNLNNLGLYSEFIQSEDKEHVHQAQVSQYPYFHIGLELLRIELHYYWTYQARLSTRLMGKSISIDFIQYRCEQSRVLKDPTSDLFVKTPYAPFNA